MEALLHAARSFFLFSSTEEAPHPIRQSRIYHGREQSFAHSGLADTQQPVR